MSWPNLNQISDSTAKLLQKNYKDNGFCFQTRLSLDEFITNNFIHDKIEKPVACQLATQLLEKLNTHISNLPNDSRMFTIRRTLTQTYINLQVCIRPGKYVQQMKTINLHGL